MARWIDASPSQRFWQYILPAARRMIESGEWDRCIADYDARIAEAATRVETAEPDSFDQRAWRRRLASLTRERDGCVTSRDVDLATIAEGARRKALKKARAA